MIRKVLIANRGEIAVRVIRACRERGIGTVAVYSDADAAMPHVRLADERVHLGAPEPAHSYLDIGKILDAARQTGADAVHPGYGFLSERESFSEAVRDAGLKFLGPPPEAMRRLGAKIEAKEIAVANDVPVTPGLFRPGATLEEMRTAADGIGYPVMLKASAGGGGRGMRIVRDPADFEREFNLASEEAMSAFGDGAMMVEKLVERPRHVEVQVLADEHGNVAPLFERECSIQRRHQKLIEESASPLFLPGARLESMWPRMRDAAVRLVKAAGYVGAGTVEFMVDEAAGEFYFLEVNARLQVEHPVTEGVTGLDLVGWQLRIADGEALDLPDALMNGDRSALHGHAIEARIVAEDPAMNFLPSVGKIVGWAEPKHPGVRVDTGFGPGTEVSRYYDSLIAKVIAHGAHRDEALDRLRTALLDFHVLGVKTNIAYILEVIDHPEFRAGRFDTGFLGREFEGWTPSTEVPGELFAIADMVQGGAPVAVAANGAAPPRHIAPAWADDGWRLTGKR